MLVCRLWAWDPDGLFNSGQLLNEKCYAHFSSLGRVHLRNSQGCAAPRDRARPRHENLDHPLALPYLRRISVSQIVDAHSSQKIVELTAQVGGQAHILDRDSRSQPVVARGCQPIRDVELIAGRDDLGIDYRPVAGELLARIDEVRVLEQQQVLNVCSLEKLAEHPRNCFAARA
jgi:hypothetical protein